MMMRIAALALLVLVGGLAQARADVTEIGTVEEIRLALYGALAGQGSERLYENDQVYADEVITTVRKSSAQIRFLDDTDLWLGESSELTLDSFIYDPDTGTGEMVAELGVGLFRFVTGNLPDGGVQINTPVAVIGVRGTDFSVAVAANGATEVTVYAGMVTVSPRGGGGGQSVGSGETAAVSTATGTVSVSPASQTAPPAAVSGGEASASATSVGGGGGGGGGGGSGSCFTPRTRVVMADGRLKAIADITPGERVLGRDGAHNVVTGIERVRLEGRLLYGFDGATPFVTAEHPFMTAEGWKSIDPSATAAENATLQVARLAPGDSLVTITRSAWRRAAFGGPGANALGHRRLGSMTATSADPATALYNLLLDGDHSYWVVQAGPRPLLRTISTAPAIPEQAYLVHNKGG